MNEKYITEKIGYYKNLVTLCWTSSFVLGSGISWGFANLKTFKLILVPSGIIFEIALLVAVVFFDLRIRKLLKEFR